MDGYVNVTYLTLGGHVHLLKYRYLYFLITLALFVLIVCSNAVIFSLICVHKSLHEPMYIFIAALLLNALLGSAALYPKLLIDLLSANQTISYPACVFQGFLLYVYAASEFTLLSAMAYDRYVSICRPLRYHAFIRTHTVKLILILAWLLPVCEVGGAAVMTSRLKLCRFTLARIVCDNFSLVKLSCGDLRMNNLYGLLIMVIAIFPPVIFILFSYMRIFTICLRRSKDFRAGALQTCLPHLFIFGIFTIISLFEVIQNRLPSDMPHIFRVAMSIQYLVIPPLFNPLIYGFKMREISQQLRALFRLKQVVR
ncbi:olfactory receptor 51E1-like [Centroberyx affinis]|uniref:olfactory receptor 51E1-like n=1 Tax=Centroberyx affinis TaxID=166261 RepID=UPI003A5C6847